MDLPQPMSKIPGHNLLTHSRITSWLTCRWKHHIAYTLGIRGEQSSALRMGDIWHHARHVLNMTGNDLIEGHKAIVSRYEPLLATQDEERYARLALECEKLRRLLDGWYRRWQDEPREIIASELSFNHALRNPKTGRRSLTWRLAGKIDAIIALPGKGLALEELKTTSDSIGPDSMYWRALRLDAQISRYMLAALELGYPVETVMYDVVHKPGIAPKKVKGVRETVSEYGERLALDIQERPEFYFARVEVPRLRSDMEDMRAELWQIAQDMRDALRKGCPYRDTDKCIGKKYVCEYLDPCSNHIDLMNQTPDGFRRLTTSLHPELEPLDVTSPTDKTATAESGTSPSPSEHGSSAGIQQAEPAASR